MIRFADFIDTATGWIGRVVAWFIPVTALLCFATVYLRYVLDFGEVWLQELYIWTHVISIMLGAAYVFKSGGFVRVDFLYSRFSRRTRAIVDILGTAFFMVPFCLFVLYGGTIFFLAAFQMNESSQYASGLRKVWLIKFTVILFAILLLLQATAKIIRLTKVLFTPKPLHS